MVIDAANIVRITNKIKMKKCFLKFLTIIVWTIENKVEALNYFGKVVMTSAGENSKTVWCIILSSFFDGK